MLIMLVLHLHRFVGPTCLPYAEYVHHELLLEKERRITEGFQNGKFEKKDWDWLRYLVAGGLMRWRGLKQVVASISAKYFEGHQLLFTADEEALNSELAFFEKTIALYDRLDMADLPADWEPITIDAPLLRQYVETAIEHIEVMAKADMLKVFGEDQAAQELVNPSGLRRLREYKRLVRQLKPDAVTC